MEEIKTYLATLLPQNFDLVSGYMIRDHFGIAHPDGGSKCTNTCSGDGSTPNGYWVQSPYPDCSCHWVPIV